MAIEIVDLPIEHGDFPQLCKRLPEGTRYYPNLAHAPNGVHTTGRHKLHHSRLAEAKGYTFGDAFVSSRGIPCLQGAKFATKFYFGKLQWSFPERNQRNLHTCDPKRTDIPVLQSYDLCAKLSPSLNLKSWGFSATLWWTNIAIENGHRNSGFSH